MNASPPWFAGVGTALTAQDRADAAAILHARGVPAGTGAIVVVSWRAAADWTEDPALAECWDDDEEEREVLWGRVAAQIGEAALLAQLTAATTEAASHVRVAAQTAAHAHATMETEVIAIAAASALLALHQYRLAQLAGVAPDHPFLLKYALFTRGRWALGYRGGTYGIY